MQSLTKKRNRKNVAEATADGSGVYLADCGITLPVIPQVLDMEALKRLRRPVDGQGAAPPRRSSKKLAVGDRQESPPCDISPVASAAKKSSSRKLGANARGADASPQKNDALLVSSPSVLNGGAGAEARQNGVEIACADVLSGLCHGRVSPKCVREYVHDRKMRSAQGRSIPEHFDSPEDVWHSWSFVFRASEVYGNAVLARGVLASKGFEHLKENILLVTSIVFRMKAMFTKTPTGMGRHLSFQEMQDRLLEEETGGVGCEPCVAIAAWLCGFDGNWGDALRAAPIGEVWLGALSTGAVCNYEPGAFADCRSTRPGGLDTIQQFCRKLCNFARAVYYVKGGAELWRCQFSNMQAVARILVTSLNYSHLDAPESEWVTAGSLLSSFSPYLENTVDFTDASYSELRHQTSMYTNDFSWMLVAAYIHSEHCDGSVSGKVSLLGKIRTLTADAQTWSMVRLPGFTLKLTEKVYESSSSSSGWPTLVAQLRGVTRNTFPLLHLQAMLELPTAAGAGYLFTFTPEHVPDAGVWFETASHAVEETRFTAGSRSRNLKGLFRVLNECVQKKSPVSAFSVASLLLHREINSMFYIDTCDAKTVLVASLKREMIGFPAATCFFSNTDFMSHASTMLWAWMFKYVEKEVPDAPHMLHSLALACEVCVRFPYLEQVAVWAAFVRVISLAGIALPALGLGLGLGGTLESDESESEIAVPGKFAGISNGRVISSCFVEELEAKRARDGGFYAEALEARYVHAAEEFLDDEPCARAAACLSNGSQKSLSDFLCYDDATKTRAIVERLLFRGDWISPDFSRVLEHVLFRTRICDVELAGVAERDADRDCELIYFSPHIDTGDVGLEALTASLKDAVDKTCGSYETLQINAVLQYLHPVRVVETLIKRVALCVQWERGSLSVLSGK